MEEFSWVQLMLFNVWVVLTSVLFVPNPLPRVPVLKIENRAAAADIAVGDPELLCINPLPPCQYPISRSTTGRQRPLPRWVKWVLRRLKVKLVDVTLRYESVGMCPLQASGS